MAAVPWLETYVLGNVGIDDDHRRFFTLLETLDDDLRSERTLTPAAVEALVATLDHHVEDHFHREEALMASLGSMPEAVRDAHRRDHDRWRRRLMQHLDPLRTSSSDLIRRAHLARILYESRCFWEEHFQLHDAQISQYLNPE
jgi:hemerythrin-like metal-binding protein